MGNRLWTVTAKPLSKRDFATFTVNNVEAATERVAIAKAKIFLGRESAPAHMYTWTATEVEGASHVAEGVLST